MVLLYGKAHVQQYELKKATEASNLDTQHQMCQSTKDSWCNYKADRLKGTNTYKENPALPTIIRETIRSVFVSLNDDNLLNKCIHGKTQTINKSLNGLIRKRCPKDVLLVALHLN